MKICRNTIGVILAVLLLAGCGSKDEEDASVPSMQESEQAPEEEKAESEAETQETPEKETLTEEAPAELTDVEKYGVSPISYDLSNLPPMENKLYAAWDGKIYFRQYSDEDMEEGGLWSEFRPVADTEKELMCMEPDGSIVQVGTDFGYGSMFIVDGRIYSQKYTVMEEHKESIVYSCALDGSDVTEYAFSKDGVYSGEVYAVKDGKVICKTARNGLAYIDTKTGQEYILVDTCVYYLDATEDEVFYYGYQESDETDERDLALYSVDYKGNISLLKTITREEYIEYADELLCQDAIDIPYFEILGDELYFAAGSYNGNAHVYSGGPIYSMKKDGSGCRVEVFSYDYRFYLYDEEESRAIYYSESGLDQCAAVSLSGDVPQDIVIPKYVVTYDEPLIHNTTGSILFYPDTSGTCYMLLTAEECEELSIELYVDGSRVQKISDIEYLDGKLFFTVTDLTYSTEESIGWRDGYVRGRSICYCKDLESGNIRLLYEY